MSYPKYPAYKHSGVGWLGDVPQHWRLQRLGHHFHERRTRASDAEYRALSVTKDGIVPQLETAAKTQDGDNRKLVLNGDFVINSRSDRKGSSGLAEQDGSVSLISIVLEPVGISGRFVHHLLRSAPFQEEFYRWGKGIVADLWSTNFSDMKNIILAVPPSTEQEAIAEFLAYETSRIDALIAEQQRLIELLKEKRQAVISQAVTKGLDPSVPMKDSGMESIGLVPTHWQLAALRHYMQIIDCKHLTADFVPDGFPLASIGEVQGFEVDLTHAKHTTQSHYEMLIEGGRKPRIGDIIYSRNATVGEAALVTTAEDFAMGQDVCLLRYRREGMSSEFMVHQLRSPAVVGQLEQLMVGATFKRINVESIRQFVITIPPTAEQEAIVAFLSKSLQDVDLLLDAAQHQIALLSERRSAMISAAVTGKIDVRNWQPPAAEAARDSVDELVHG